MCNSDDGQQFGPMPINDLKRKLDHAASLMAIIDPEKSLGIVADRADCQINRDQKVTCSHWATFRVPRRSGLQILSRTGMEINPHRGHHVWRTAVVECLTNFPSRRFPRQVRHFGG